MIITGVQRIENVWITETLAQMVSSEFWEIFKNAFFIEYLWGLLLYFWKLRFHFTFLLTILV